MRLRLYYVYILASRNRVLYTGITGNLEQRLIQHRYHDDPASFTAQYHCDQLVYFEEYTRVVDAIARENQIKSWRRSKKIALINSLDPEWHDLAPTSSRA
jgi:putative endonuclease